MPRISHTAGVWLVFIALWGGCAAAHLSPLNFTIRLVPQKNREGVLQQARITLINFGYVVRPLDHTGEFIATQPVDESDHRRILRRGLTGYPPGKNRRVVQIHVEPVDQTLKIFCKVLIQRQATEAYRLLALDHAVSDSPAQTPIERDAATTTEQNTVWQNVRRDQFAERRILSAILEQIGENVTGP